MKTLFRAVRRFLLSDVFIRLVWLILIICVLVLVFKGITVTHKGGLTVTQYISRRVFY